MRKVLLVTLCLISTAFAIPAIAQEGSAMPKGRWWRMPMVVEKLALTPEQQNKLDDVYAANSKELVDFRGNVEKAGIEMRALLEKSTSARKDVLAAAAKLGDARSKLFEREISMMLDMRALLSDQQWTALKQAIEERAIRQKDRPMGSRRPDGEPRPPRPE